VSEGLHTIYFKAMDDAGNANSDTCSYSWSFTYGIPKISLFPSSQLDKCGNVDTLWVYADNSVVNMEAAFFKIGYDKNFITPTNVIKGPALSPPGNFSLFSQIYPDSILINLAVLVGHFNGPGEIIGVILTADHETALTSLSFDRSVLRDTLNQDIPHTNAGGTIEIDCTAPAIPMLLRPADVSSTCDVTPLFVWTKCVDLMAPPVTYTLQYCFSPSFSNPITVEGIADTTYNVPDSIALDDTTYYWRVEAMDIANNHSGYQAYACRFSVFVLGDVNRDGSVTVADVVYLINYLFKGGPAPDPLMRGDVNHYGNVTVADAVFLINYLFKGGPAPTCTL
jgi:hypothetical protein